MQGVSEVSIGRCRGLDISRAAWEGNAKCDSGQWGMNMAITVWWRY